MANSWGRIIYDENEEDPSDPVIKLLKQIDNVRETLPWEKEETFEEFERRQGELINELEHQISDIIYKRTLRKIAR